jgi:hypothetical protein
MSTMFKNAVSDKWSSLFLLGQNDTKKVFITLIPGVNVIKHFTAAIYECF